MHTSSVWVLHKGRETNLHLKVISVSLFKKLIIRKVTVKGFLLQLNIEQIEGNSNDPHALRIGKLPKASKHLFAAVN